MLSANRLEHTVQVACQLLSIKETLPEGVLYYMLRVRVLQVAATGQLLILNETLPESVL